MTQGYESVSTWRQPLPAPASAQRTRLVADVAARPPAPSRWSTRSSHSRPELDDLWEYRIWLDIDVDQSITRMVARDAAREGVDGATSVHRDRYHPAELVYLAEVDPLLLADAVIDNRDFANPTVRYLTPPRNLAIH